MTPPPLSRQRELSAQGLRAGRHLQVHYSSDNTPCLSCDQGLNSRVYLRERLICNLVYTKKGWIAPTRNALQLSCLAASPRLSASPVFASHSTRKPMPCTSWHTYIPGTAQVTASPGTPEQQKLQQVFLGNQLSSARFLVNFK